MKKAAFTVLLAFSEPGLSEVLPSADKTVYRMLPEEPGFKTDTAYKRKFEEVKSQVEALRKEAEAARSTLRAGDLGPSLIPRNLPSPLPQAPATAGTDHGSEGPDLSETPRPPADPAEETPVEFAPVKAEMLDRLPHKKVPLKGAPGAAPRAPNTPFLPFSGAAATLEAADPATTTLVYGVSHPEAYDETMTVLPAGSFVKARIVSGVEANTLEPYPVLLQLEYAFTGPNKSKVDLSNCFMIAKARANLSTERVIMETETLSCVGASGEHFKSSAKGYTAGEDSTFGSTGVLISKQGQVMLAAVLASIAKNAGEAVATAQQTTTVAGYDRAQTATNVTGNKAAFIAGRATIDGAAMIAQWYLDYAKQLVPSIGIGSGQTVHVVMLETIRVPTLAE